MARIQIPLDVFTSRLNLSERLSGLRAQSFGSRFANIKPISEFLDFKRLSKPADFGETQSRVNWNLSYFSSNYAAVFVMLSIYSLVTNPLLLFVIFLVQSALARIRRAQEKGKLEVKLREDELAALENRRKRLAAEALAAKALAAKAKKSKPATPRKKKTSPPMVTVPIKQAETSRPSSRRHSKATYADPALMESYAAEYRPPSRHAPEYRPSSRHAPEYRPPSRQAPEYRPPSSHHDFRPPSSHASPGRSRSSSTLARPGSQHYAYPPQLNSRHVSDGSRPVSSASMQMPMMMMMRAPLPHEEGWEPMASRRGSVSSQSQFGHDPFEYQVREEGEDVDRW